MTRWVVVVALAMPGCFGGSSNTTETGLGKPSVGVEIPAQVEAGSTQEFVVTIANPGPGDMDTVVVAFALVGPVRSDGSLPTPLVSMGGESSVVSVDPEPAGISDNGTVYVFGDTRDAAVVAEGEEFQVTFTIETPDESGTAANSVQVYDGSEVERAAGARLETLVE